MNELMEEKEEVSEEEKQELIRIHNRKVAREGSWIHALFEEAGFTLKDKQEIWKRLIGKNKC